MEIKEAVVTLDPQTEKDLKHLAVLKGAEVMVLLNQLVQRAVKDACYRHRRNQQVWEQKKALAERQADLVQKAKAAGIDVSMFE